jgi:hypothetical protein
MWQSPKLVPYGEKGKAIISPPVADPAPPNGMGLIGGLGLAHPRPA